MVIKERYLEFDTDDKSKAAVKSREKAEKAIRNYLSVYLRISKDNIKVTCRGLSVDVHLSKPLMPVSITDNYVGRV